LNKVSIRAYIPFDGHLTLDYQATARSALKGPVDGKDYTYRDTFDLATTVLAPCGANTVLNINDSLQVSNSGNTKGSGYIATDSVDASLTQVFGQSRFLHPP
jgi:hypothetical protein